MNLIDALEHLKRPVAADAPPLRVFLACGFTPLHLQTFIAAHLRIVHPARRVEVKSGLFGDLVGNLERLRGEEHDTLAVVIEWSDLDSRLGLRILGGWQVDDLPDIAKSVSDRLGRLIDALHRLPPDLPVGICLPTLPLPPISYANTQRSSAFELNLRSSLASFAESLSVRRQVSVVSAQHLDEVSPLGKRFDLRTEVTQGFPYTTVHASVVGELLAELTRRPQPKKGLITDLDDTLWAGILGEVGTQGISWHLEEHAHLHGLYQQMLKSLASAGTLVAVATKNDANLVAEAFEREDLLLPKANIFPIEAHWTRKSESVRRILKTWNVLADSVIFIDDSPMEVAEVKEAFPDMECLVFPKDDYAAVWRLLSHLRNRFAKTTVSDEDAIRLESIRRSSTVHHDDFSDGHSLDGFLQQAEGHLRFALGKSSEDLRAFELVNKTNQFNLNGKRYDQTAWSAMLKDADTRLITVSYDDKFGRLGTIAVLIGRLVEGTFVLESWVMSCRAFSRRIEHHCLQYLFETFAATAIVFEVQTTTRNAPLTEFLQGFVECPLGSDQRLSKAAFLSKAPALPHTVAEVSANGG